MVNLSTNPIYHGINWIYTFTETPFMYDFNISYNWFTNNIYQDTFDFNYYSFWYSTLDISYFTLFWSVLLDKFLVSNLFKLPYQDNWFKFLNQSYESSLALVNHPEYFFISDFFTKTFILPFSSEIDNIIFVLNDEENFLNPVLILPHIIVICLFIMFFITMYFSYYNSSVKEENTIDHDYLIANATVESEEEIGSLDDMLLSILILSYIFLWYFYINCWSVIFSVPEFFLTIYLFPLLYYIIMCIPAFLAYDYGLYFVAYLRGVGPSPLILVELLYDYIAFAGFYIRLVVQNVRLILMTFTFASFHEAIITHGIEKEWIIGDENFLDDINKVLKTPTFLTYFLVFKVPGHIIYFFYELFHTLFVVTAQFIAFFAMVFWLFLFLYTMFVSELQEKFFFQKRAVKKEFYDRFFSLKQNILSKK
jgi:hypothetical protein